MEEVQFSSFEHEPFRRKRASALTLVLGLALVLVALGGAKSCTRAGEPAFGAQQPAWAMAVGP